LLLDSLPDGIHLARCLNLTDQRQALGTVCSFADQEKNIFLGAGRKVNVELQGGAGSNPAPTAPIDRRAAGPQAPIAQKPIGLLSRRAFLLAARKPPFINSLLKRLAAARHCLGIEFRRTWIETYRVVPGPFSQ
jgi:hypothetical protein